MSFVGLACDSVSVFIGGGFLAGLNRYYLDSSVLPHDSLRMV